jgi:hypothetical protein
MSTGYSSVKTLHRDYIANASKWKKIRDVLAANCRSYLRDVSSSETDQDYKKQRQEEYETGGVFYNFTKRTLSGMVGAVMRKPAEVLLPADVEYLLTNCDGAGMGIEAQSQDTLREVDSVGRAGLLVDAPETAAATMAEQNAGQLNPRIQLYTAENIINWRRSRKGSTQVLTLVVLREPYEYQAANNEFDWLQGEQYRVLEIVDGKYRQRLFVFDSAGAQVGDSVEPVIPMVKGKPLDYIPFQFIGSDNNDESIDPAPLETMSDINIGHFRNSADVEDSAFYQQGTLILAPGENMSGQMFKELHPNGLRMGARIGYNLGAGGSAQIVQPDPNNLSFELMRSKEDQAVKAGAQLITPTVQITAEASRLQRGADTSIMATIAINVSKAYEQAIKWCGAFLGQQYTDEDVTFELNMEFFLTQMGAQEIMAWLGLRNAGIMPDRAMWAAFRAAGITNWTDEEIEAELERQPPVPAPALNTTVQGEIPEAPDQSTDDQQ